MPTIQFNDEGFLTTLEQWSIDVANQIATNESLELSEEHVTIINIARSFYLQYKLHPSMRVLIKLLKQTMPAQDNLDSIYVHIKFPGGIKQLSKIAGLPKPINCI
jgi:tRNA 2-thiouridine synthesizing protein E